MFTCPVYAQNKEILTVMDKGRDAGQGRVHTGTSGGRPALRTDLAVNPHAFAFTLQTAPEADAPHVLHLVRLHSEQSSPHTFSDAHRKRFFSVKV